MVWDAIIVGAGPAGLTAAAYLGRFRRSALVLHDGKSRARWIPTSHNTPGFPAGVSGPDLLARLQSQALQYGATTLHATVIRIDPRKGGVEVVTESQTYHARFVVLATGVADKLPPLVGIEQAIERGVIRICPICDGYEAIDKAIAVLGDGLHGVREAEYLTTYSKRVSLIHTGPPLHTPQRERLAANNISLIVKNLHDLQLGKHNVAIDIEGECVRFDVCYVALGCAPQTTLLSPLKVALDQSGALVVNAHQETSVKGIYAAGDVVRGLNQITVASAEGAIVATDIHNRLRLEA